MENKDTKEGKEYKGEAMINTSKGIRVIQASWRP
jgi:hypothetical protein